MTEIEKPKKVSVNDSTSDLQRVRDKVGHFTNCCPGTGGVYTGIANHDIVQGTSKN